MSSQDLPGVTMYVTPRGTMSGEFIQKARFEYGQGHTNFVFEGVTFYMVCDHEGYVVGYYIILNDPREPFPTLSFDAFSTYYVTMRLNKIPAQFAVTPGWYESVFMGFPGACCLIDPQGKDGQPKIEASGSNRDNVIRLYLEVMAGRLSPSMPY